MSKRKDSTGDFKDLAVIIMGFGLLMLILIMVAIVQAVIAFWYITVPLGMGIGYMYLKHKQTVPEPEKPTYKLIETTDNTKTIDGDRKIYTKEIYDPALPKPAEHPILSILSRII